MFQLFTTPRKAYYVYNGIRDGIDVSITVSYTVLGVLITTSSDNIGEIYKNTKLLVLTDNLQSTWMNHNQLNWLDESE